MARDRLARTKGRKTSGTFLLVPSDVLRSAAYCGLSFKAKALIMDVGVGYNGHNNGHLSAAWALMKRQGWISKETLQRALEELLANGLIEKTRQGGKHQCSLFGFTWLPIHAGKAHLDVSHSRVASGAWRTGGAKISDKPANLLPRSPGHISPTIGL